MGQYFVDGAWLHSLPSELSERQFIEYAGGIDNLSRFRDYPFVSLILDTSPPMLVGHFEGATIAMAMQQRGHTKYQTMEWK